MLVSAEVLIAGLSLVLSKAYERSLALRVRLNKQILENPYWFLPVDDKGYENYTPVGRGEKSSDFCAVFRRFKGCKNFLNHESGGMVVRLKHWWCHKPNCTVCFIRGWAVRGARSIIARLEEGVRRGFGKIESISVSVPPEDYGLPEEVLRKRCRDALFDRGVSGGCMIFHGFRIDKIRRVLGWSVHYHFVGFIKGGFDRCRECVHEYGDCASCDGFKGREVRGFARDRYLVKVHEERESVFGSAWYFLHHATVKVSFLKRFHSFTWIGVCGNRKYSSAQFIESAEDVCLECGEEMKDYMYTGECRIVKDVGDADYKPCFVVSRAESDDFVEIVGRYESGFSGSREYG